MIGAGGHAKVVIEALIANGHHFGQIIARDGNSARQGQRIGEVWIAHPEIEPAMAGDKAHVAIGSGDVRAKLYARALAIGCHAMTIIHPAAHVSPSAVIGAGSFIAAGAIVAASAVVGTGCIINHGAVVDHERGALPDRPLPWPRELGVPTWRDERALERHRALAAHSRFVRRCGEPGREAQGCVLRVSRNVAR